MKQKLLFVINQLFRGGAETSLIAMLKGLDKSAFQVDLVVYDHHSGTAQPDLIQEIPEWVTAFIQDTNRKKITDKLNPFLVGPYSSELLEFVSSREYDLAISFGEWLSPELVMKYANSKKKAIWLHSSIAQSPLVNFDELFRYDYRTDFYICVSRLFAEHTAAQFPFLQKKVAVIHNCSDVDSVLKQAQEEPPSGFSSNDGVPVILSVGNLRPEKNYLRAVGAAAILKRKKIPFRWYCVGAFSHETTVNEIKKSIEKNALQEDFILLGPTANPYPLMKHASVLVSSSDHESWSMVISEAKVLNLPVITTKTDGAVEQLTDGKNSLFCELSPESVAEKLELYLGSPEIQRNFRANLREKNSRYSAADELQKLISLPDKKKTELLFVIDNTNYRGGAHTATCKLMQELVKKGHSVEVFSGSSPTVETRNLFSPVPIISLDISQIKEWESIPFRQCLFSKEFSLKDKLCKFKRAVEKRLFAHWNIWRKEISLLLSQFFSGYQRICVMSEGSFFRKEVALSSCPYKFQMIHTNYGEWCRFSEYTRGLSADDSQIYSKMDSILLISRKSKESFLDIFPEFKEKSFNVRNVICVQGNVERRYTVSSPVHLLTIARLEDEKDIPRMISIAARLKAAGLRFDWTLLGTSSLLDYYREQTKKNNIDDVFHLEGQVPNVAPFLNKADLFVLLSHYEGLPNTVFEALISGVPVLATAVGGLPEQIEDGKTGYLVQDEANVIFEKMLEICSDPEKIISIRRKLSNYRYDNEKVLEDYVSIFQL